MTPEQELRELELEIARLKKEKETLEKLKNLRAERLKLKLENVPKRFAAKHPHLTSAGKGTFDFFKYVGKNVVANEERSEKERSKRHKARS
jgi:ribosome-interacting GTPase 1